MGLLDDLRDRVELIDTSEDHLLGHGFSPSVCEGCPHRVTDHPDLPCDLCGCATTPLNFMDLSDGPPANCIRLDRHAEES